MSPNKHIYDLPRTLKVLFTCFGCFMVLGGPFLLALAILPPRPDNDQTAPLILSLLLAVFGLGGFPVGVIVLLSTLRGSIELTSDAVVYNSGLPFGSRRLDHRNIAGKKKIIIRGIGMYALVSRKEGEKDFVLGKLREDDYYRRWIESIPTL